MQLPSNPPPLLRYGFAIAVSIAALVISLLFLPLFARTPFLLFFLAIVLASWYGGLGPGLVATGSALILTNLFLFRAINFNGFDVIELVLFVVFATVATIVSLLYNARHRSELQLAERLNTLTSIYELSNTVNRAPSVEVIFDNALDALLRAIKADRASILLFDEKGLMQFKAWRGLSEGYRAAAAGHSPWTIETRNPQPVLVPDVKKDPALEALRPVIVGEGIRSLAFIPLVSGERLLGKFMVYYNMPHVYEREQIQVAQTIASQIAFALERRATEEALQQSRRQLEIILHGITDGITVQEPTGKLIYANDAAARLLGFNTPEELIATPVLQVVQKFQVLDEAGDPLPLERLPGRIALSGELPEEQLVRFRLLESGKERWSIVNAAPVFDPQGQVLFVVNMFRDFTERRRAEQAEREQRELLQVILASIGDAVIATDAKGFITFMNPVAAKLTQWSEEDARMQPLTEVFNIINEETRQPVESPVAAVLTQGVIVGLANHTLLITRQGKELPIDDSGAPICDAKGEVVGVVLVFRDVTAQRQAQIELGRLAAIVESTEDAIYAKSLDGTITSWNQGAEQLFGYTASAMMGQSVGILMPPAYLHELEENLALIKNDKSIKASETQRRDHAGRLIDVSVTISPVKNQDGKIIGASTIARDVTERKRSEEERARLYTAEQQARSQAELAQQRLTVLAEASRILSASLDYETTLGNVAQFIVPLLADWCVVHIVQEDGTLMPLAVAHTEPSKVALIHELQRRYPPDPSAQTGVAKVVRTKQPDVITEITDDWLVRSIPDPELLQIIRALGFRSAMTVPLVVRDRVVGTLGFVTAESGRLYGPEDLALAQDLARRAAAAIDNSRLYRETEAAIRVRDQFLSLASHELKTPITSIMGFAELLQRRTVQAEKLTERDHRALYLIYAQSSRLAQLINSLLDLSRIDGEQFVIEPAPLDLNALTTRVVESLRLTSEAHTLTYSSPNGPLVIEGDEMRLEQVLQNLIQNAIKYSPNGGLIGVTLEQQQDRACLTVSDEGIGIPETALDQLFERFYRAENVKAHRISGMGIGLFVAKQIVSLHGGEIQVRSQENAGSTFIVCLPLARLELSSMGKN